MAVKLIDLQLIYGVAGAREKFEELASHLVKAEIPEADKVRIKSGDGGIDVHVGELTDRIEVFQCKFFPQGLDESRKGQIRDSFKTCRTAFKLKRWTLCLPLDLSPDEKVWFEKWRKDQAAHGIEIPDPWGATTLEGLLYQPKNRGLREVFFKEEHLTQIREVHSLLLRLVPDIAARLKDGSAADSREAEARARGEEYLDEFRKGLRERFAALTKPNPPKLSELQRARREGDHRRAADLQDAGRRRGRWEVLIHPSRVPRQTSTATLKECRSVVEACQVRSHGWSFPVLPPDGQESGRDWLGMSKVRRDEAECWRLSQRGVFGHASTIFDDLQPPPQVTERWARLMPPGFVPRRFLDLDVATRFITHAFRFAARLAEKVIDPDEPTATVAVTLTDTRDRVLITRDDTSRMDGWYVASAPSLEHAWDCDRGELLTNPDGHAVKAALWFFERFNWVNATEELVARTQARVFTGA